MGLSIIANLVIIIQMRWLRALFSNLTELFYCKRKLKPHVKCLIQKKNEYRMSALNGRFVYLQIVFFVAVRNILQLCFEYHKSLIIIIIIINSQYLKWICSITFAVRTININFPIISIDFRCQYHFVRIFYGCCSCSGWLIKKN